MPTDNTTSTGLGATLTTFGFTGITIANWEIASLTGFEETIAALDNTHLGSTTHMEKVPASLADISPITATLYWNYEENVGFGGGMTPAEVVSVTIGYPDRVDSIGDPLVSGGQLTGDAFITRIKYPDNNGTDRSIGEIDFQFDGKTGPTLTAWS